MLLNTFRDSFLRTFLLFICVSINSYSLPQEVHTEDFLKGESLYKSRRYQDAISLYQRFQFQLENRFRISQKYDEWYDFNGTNSFIHSRLLSCYSKIGDLSNSFREYKWLDERIGRTGEGFEFFSRIETDIYKRYPTVYERNGYKFGIALKREDAEKLMDNNTNTYLVCLPQTDKGKFESLLISFQYPLIRNDKDDAYMPKLYINGNFTGCLINVLKNFDIYHSTQPRSNNLLIFPDFGGRYGEGIIEVFSIYQTNKTIRIYDIDIR